MNAIRHLLLAAVSAVLLVACGGAPHDALPAPAAQNQTEHEAHDEHGGGQSEEAAATSLAPIELAPYTVAVDRLGEIADGHINLYVEGGEVAAVRVWIGDEAATNAFIGKAEWEDTHHCAHLEVAETLPEGAQLWVELETPEGAVLKGATPL